MLSIVVDHYAACMDLWCIYQITSAVKLPHTALWTTRAGRRHKTPSRHMGPSSGLAEEPTQLCTTCF